MITTSIMLSQVVGIYGDFLSSDEVPASRMSEKGVLQVLFDLKFVSDILSGGNANVNEELSEAPNVRSPFRRKSKMQQPKLVVEERTKQLVNRLSQRLDPIDWLT